MGTVRKDHIRKLMCRDCETGETNIRSLFSTRRLWLDKTVSSHLSQWDWLKWYCCLYRLRLYLVMYQINQQFQSLWLPQVTDMRQKENPGPFPLKRIPTWSSCTSRWWPLQESWPQMKFRREGKHKVNGNFLKNYMTKNTHFYIYSVGQEDYLSGCFVSFCFLK